MSEFSEEPHPGSNLTAYREYAQWVLDDIRDTVELYPDLAGPSAELTGRAEEVLEAANSVVVSIGVFGEYNTGKSLTLGTLVGNPLLLPVKAEPATANVTRLRLIASGSDEPARITAAYAEYFRADELPGYVAAFIRQAAREARKFSHEAAANEIAALEHSPDVLPELADKLARLGTPGDSLTALAAEVSELDAALRAGPPLGAKVNLDPRDPWRLVAYGGRGLGTGPARDPMTTGSSSARSCSTSRFRCGHGICGRWAGPGWTWSTYRGSAARPSATVTWASRNSRRLPPRSQRSTPRAPAQPRPGSTSTGWRSGSARTSWTGG